jgi:hypothetical protein
VPSASNAATSTKSASNLESICNPFVSLSNNYMPLGPRAFLIPHIPLIKRVL